MKITKLDTGVTAIEMDPNKTYMFIVDLESHLQGCDISMEHGTILYKSRNDEIIIIETPEVIKRIEEQDAKKE